jgi:hypothetical protein
MGKTLLTYAKADCHDFAVAFHAAMPREIRDQVYTLLFDSMSDRLKTQSRITSSDPYSALVLTGYSLTLLVWTLHVSASRYVTSRQTSCLQMTPTGTSASN